MTIYCKHNYKFIKKLSNNLNSEKICYYQAPIVKYYIKGDNTKILTKKYNCMQYLYKNNLYYANENIIIYIILILQYKIINCTLNF